MYINVCTTVFSVLLITILLGQLVSSKPIKRKPNSKYFGKTNAAKWVSKYGYLPKTENNSESDGGIDSETLVDAIEDFQSSTGLNTTGALDDETIKLMLTPRCGVTNKSPGDDDYATSRRKRSPGAIHGSPWNKTVFTYKLMKLPDSSTHNLSRNEINAELRKAFNFWEEKTNLIFKEAKIGPGDFEVRFERGDHDDGYEYETSSVRKLQRVTLHFSGRRTSSSNKEAVVKIPRKSCRQSRTE